MEEFFTTTTES